MGIELQLRTPALIELTTRTLKQALRTTCLPSSTGLSIDRIEVIGSGATVMQVGSAVEILIPADVFLVADADLMAAANGTPQGATTPAGNIVFPVRLEVQTADEPLPIGSGTRRRVWLRLVPQRPLLGPLEGPLGSLADAIWNGISGSMPRPREEITRLVDILKMVNLDQVDVATGEGVVSVRFGVAGPAQSHLDAAQDWGLFVSGDAVTGMIRGVIEPNLKGALSIVDVGAQYRNDGTIPRVNVSVSAMLNILSARLGAAIELWSTLQLLSGPAPVLRMAANWGIGIETALLIPIFGPVAALAMKPVAERIATEIVSGALDVTDFGATPTGDTSFVFDQSLPPLELGLAALRYDNLVASPAGMVFGGAVVLGAIASTPFRLTVSRFGAPTRIQLCSVLAKTGSGDPSRELPTLANTRVFASAEIEGAGRFCKIERRGLGPEWSTYVASPAEGSIAESGTIDVKMNYQVALNMPGPMQFVVRTPRGVRYVDFGQPPPPTFDEQGRLIVLVDGYIDDCNYLVEGERGGWGIGWHPKKEDFRPTPLEWPGWAETPGVIVQLVTLQGLDAGESVRFRSATHTIEATADANGRLMLPVLLPLSPVSAPALLERADGRTLVGHISVETAAFERVAALSGPLAEPVAGLRSGGLRLVTQTESGLMKHSVGVHGIVSAASLQANRQSWLPNDDAGESLSRVQRLRLSSEADKASLNPQPLPPGGGDLAWLNPQPLPPDGGGLAALNPQPLPPGGGDLAWLNPQPLPPDGGGFASLNPQPLPPVDDGAWPADLVRRSGLRGVQGITWIPGFAKRSVALADVGNSRHLLLDLAGGKVRVAGVLNGPFDALNTSKHFAFSAHEDQVVVFHRLEAPPPLMNPLTQPGVDANIPIEDHTRESWPRSPSTI